jgi:hypothetical protein
MIVSRKGCPVSLVEFLVCLFRISEDFEPAKVKLFRFVLLNGN